jgi:hypothetical protein
LDVSGDPKHEITGHQQIKATTNAQKMATRTQVTYARKRAGQQQRLWMAVGLEVQLPKKPADKQTNKQARNKQTNKQTNKQGPFRNVGFLGAYGARRCQSDGPRRWPTSCATGISTDDIFNCFY